MLFPLSSVDICFFSYGLSFQVCGVEQPVPSICFTVPSKLGLRLPQCSKTDVTTCGKSFMEGVVQTEAPRLYRTSYNGNRNGGTKLPNPLHKIQHCPTVVDNRIHEQNLLLPLQVMQFHVPGAARVDEHGQREHLANVACHGLTGTHECDDGCVLLMLESVARGRIAQDVRDVALFQADNVGQQLCCEMSPGALLLRGCAESGLRGEKIGRRGGRGSRR